MLHNRKFVQPCVVNFVTILLQQVSKSWHLCNKCDIFIKLVKSWLQIIHKLGQPVQTQLVDDFLTDLLYNLWDFSCAIVLRTLHKWVCQSHKYSFQGLRADFFDLPRLYFEYFTRVHSSNFSLTRLIYRIMCMRRTSFRNPSYSKMRTIFAFFAVNLFKRFKMFNTRVQKVCHRKIALVYGLRLKLYIYFLSCKFF